jgi:hypothetical protein
MPSEDIDVKSDTFNLEDMSLDEVLDGIIETIEKFRKRFDGRSIYCLPGGNPVLGTNINPRGDGDFWFWIGGQVK